MILRRIYIFILLILILISSDSFSQQKLTNQNRVLLNRFEDSLRDVSKLIFESSDITERFKSDSMFTRILIRALKLNYSFYYPFDSLVSISRLNSPDSSFRIFSWQVEEDGNIYKTRGAIQMRTEDGSLKLFPLIDRKTMIINHIDTITNNESWIGAIYYKIIITKFNNIKYYTLLGYDENNQMSTIKRIEVMRFDKLGKPIFGGAFSFTKDTPSKSEQARFWMEFKKDGNARMNYDSDLGMIVFEHLVSETNETDKKFTYIPDGDYEGFKWVNGKWLHIEKVFTLKLEDGQAPVVAPVTEKKLGGGK